jgi:hypothetical protein
MAAGFRSIFRLLKDVSGYKYSPRFPAGYRIISRLLKGLKKNREEK